MFIGCLFGFHITFNLNFIGFPSGFHRIVMGCSSDARWCFIGISSEFHRMYVGTSGGKTDHALPTESISGPINRGLGADSCSFCRRFFSFSNVRISGLRVYVRSGLAARHTGILQHACRLPSPPPKMTTQPSLQQASSVTCVAFRARACTRSMPHGEDRHHLRHHHRLI